MLGIFQPVEKKEIPIKDIFAAQSKLANVKNAPTFYKASALPELLKVATRSGVRNDGDKVLRFLLSTNSNLIFAKEGYPSGSIPAHFQMANLNYEHAKCLTAGNAFFNDKGELCKINHKSGDFRPSFDSLQFVFPALLKAGIPIAKELEIEKLNEKGGFEQRFKIDAEMIKQLNVSNQNDNVNTNKSKLAKATSTSQLFEKFGTDIATYDPKKAYHESDEAKPYKPVEDKWSKESENKKDYEHGIKQLVDHLSDRSSTKKKYQEVLKTGKPGMCLSQLVTLANDAVKKRASGKKNNADENTQIHEAISKADFKVPYEKSDISVIVNSYSQKEEISSKRRPGK